MPDTAQPLHPNLAVIAAEYDRLVAQFAAGELDAQEANRRIDALIARDDAGVQWRLGGTDGTWHRQLISGEWVPGEPPAAGIATPTAVSLDPDAGPLQGIHRFLVDDDVAASGRLTGSTRLAAAPQERGRDARVVVLLAVCAVLGLALLLAL